MFEHSMIEEPFYACPRYMKKDENHPNGHEEGEKSCTNRLSIEEARHIMEKLDELADEAAANHEFPDFTNLVIKRKNGVTAKIIKYTPEETLISIKNTRKV